MDKQLARQYFMRGKVHPACPKCGGQSLRIVGRANYDNDVWHGYYCLRCGEKFLATIEQE